MKNFVWRDFSVRRRHLQQGRLLGENGQMPIAAQSGRVCCKEQAILAPVDHGHNVRSGNANVRSAGQESDVSFGKDQSSFRIAAREPRHGVE